MPSDAEPKTILLVDDSVTIRMLVRAYLVGHCYEFLETADGRQALQMVRYCPPALVICDVFMPLLSGWDFVRLLRKEPEHRVRSVPVILASSKKEEEVARRSIESGADAFLPKPIAGERLVRLMQSLLARSTPQG